MTLTRSRFGLIAGMLSWLMLLLSSGLETRALAAGVPPLGAPLGTLGYVVRDMVTDPNRPRIYATTAVNSVIAIDTVNRTVAGEIVIGSSPRGLDISPDGTRLYVACNGSTTAGIGVVDLDTFTKLPSLSVAGATAPRDVVAGKEGRIYVLANKLLQVDPATGAVQATVVPEFGGPVSIYAGALEINAARTVLYYGDQGLSPATLARFDVSTPTAVFLQKNDHGRLGSNGQDVIINHSGTALCYPCGGGQAGYDIALIPADNVNGWAGLFDTDAYPSNGAFSPDDTRFYTASYTENKLQVFDTTSFLEIGSFSLGGSSWRDTTKIKTDRTGRALYLAMEDQIEIYDAGTGKPVLITSSLSETAHQDEAFSYTATANAAGVKFSASGLPSGLSIDRDSGIISGAPAQAGTFSVILTGTDAEGISGDATLRLTVLTPVTVTIVGQGSITPGYLGTTWRAVGSQILIDATPDVGHGFVKWTGSVALLTKNGARISGAVGAKMSITANFAEKTSFEVAVSGPGGVAPVPLGVSSQFKGTNLSLTAQPHHGARFIGWTGSVVSDSASISFEVVAGMSLVANFEMIPRTQINIAVNGPGSVTPALLGATTHDVGAPLTVVADPAPGARFLGWTGSIVSTNPTQNFTAEPGFNLVAVFESLLAYAGGYVLQTEPAATGIASMRVQMTVMASGVFSALIRFEGRRLGFAGNITSPDGAEIAVPRAQGGLVVLKVWAAMESGKPIVFGTVTAGNDVFSIRGSRTILFPKIAPPVEAGTYRWGLMPGSSTAAPGGCGFGTARMSNTGALRLTGVLGDGTAFTAGDRLLEDGSVIITSSLYRGRGALEGTVRFREVAKQSDFDGSFGWLAPKSKRFPSGFTTTLAFQGCRTVVPSPGANIFAGAVGKVTLAQGGLDSEQETSITLAPRNVVLPVLPDPNALRLKLNARSNAFSGSFIFPGETKRTKFRGIILGKPQAAYGFFLRTAGSGGAFVEMMSEE